ncbi:MULTISPECIES: DUF1048 domain-containing protein [Streptomyces]|uniref:Uncharacterized protein n=1 Tax=Streptomyces yunnanensis TaxID=156453 RepID=A0A9X8N8E5_9ACTN|nr:MULTISPECIES: DUF1048 domain-containing protein [Streptomyces]SHN28073.1 Protein of unknown function [Streptomyces yunnanensis]
MTMSDAEMGGFLAKVIGPEPFEQAAVDGTPIREIVGQDPVEFVEAFVQNYSEGG